MTVTLDYTTAVALLDEIVAERPDYVYVSPEGQYGACYYRDPSNGAASCIIGKVFGKLGVLDKINPKFAMNMEGIKEVIAFLVKEEAIKFDDPDEENAVVSLFSSVQCSQDEKTNWGDSLAHAKVDPRTYIITEREETENPGRVISTRLERS